MRRRMDISGSCENESSGLNVKPNAMGLLLSWGTTSSSTESPGVAATRTRRQVTAFTSPKSGWPHHSNPVSSTRTSIDSPGLITRVGYILIAGRSAAAQHGGNHPHESAVGPLKRPLVWSYPAGPVNSRSTRVQSLGSVSGRVNVPSPPDVAVSFGGVLPSPSPLGKRHRTLETDTRTFATGPPVSALTRRPPNSTVAVGLGDGSVGGLSLQPTVMTTETPRPAMTTRARERLRI